MELLLFVGLAVIVLGAIVYPSFVSREKPRDPADLVMIAMPLGPAATGELSSLPQDERRSQR